MNHIFPDAAASGGTPDRPATPAHLAAQATEAVQELCRVTRSSEAYQWAGDVSQVIGELATLLGALPQAVEQARAWLAAEQSAGRLAHDRYPVPDDVRTEVASLSRYLRDAAALASDLGVSLTHAHDVASHLTGGRS